MNDRSDILNDSEFNISKAFFGALGCLAASNELGLGWGDFQQAWGITTNDIRAKAGGVSQWIISTHVGGQLSIFCSGWDGQDSSQSANALMNSASGTKSYFGSQQVMHYAGQLYDTVRATLATILGVGTTPAVKKKVNIFCHSAGVWGNLLAYDILKNWGTAVELMGCYNYGTPKIFAFVSPAEMNNGPVWKFRQPLDPVVDFPPRQTISPYLLETPSALLGVRFIEWFDACQQVYEVSRKGFRRVSTSQASSGVEAGYELLQAFFNGPRGFGPDHQIVTYTNHLRDIAMSMNADMASAPTAGTADDFGQDLWFEDDPAAPAPDGGNVPNPNPPPPVVAPTTVTMLRNFSPLVPVVNTAKDPAQRRHKWDGHASQLLTRSINMLYKVLDHDERANLNWSTKYPGKKLKHKATYPIVVDWAKITEEQLDQIYEVLELLESCKLPK